MKFINLIREKIVAFALVGWCMFWITAAVISVVITLRRRTAFWLARNVWAPYLLKIAGVSREIQGIENLLVSEPQIFIMNHQSYLDIPVAFASLRSDLHFIGKKELRYLPFVGWYMWVMGMIFIDRSKSYQAIASMKKAGELIRNGKSVLAFPEGTRSKDGQIGSFKRGIFQTALEAGVPIVPVAIQGARDLMPPGNFSIRSGKVKLAIGEPIPTEGLTAKDRDKLIHDTHVALVSLQTLLS